MIPSVLPTYNRAPLTFVSGEGSWLTEADGRRFLDLGAGDVFVSIPLGGERGDFPQGEVAGLGDQRRLGGREVKVHSQLLLNRLQ